MTEDVKVTNVFFEIGEKAFKCAVLFEVTDEGAGPITYNMEKNVKMICVFLNY